MAVQRFPARHPHRAHRARIAWPRAVADVLEIGALPSAAHRPWPVPDSPWIMAQTWERLLFAHWPLPARTLRPLIPARLTLQTFEGHAWLGLTAFVVSVLRPRAGPSIPGVAPFPELNARTYVSLDDKPGVFFWSLDAGSALAVAGARALYSLPYFSARFRLVHDSPGLVFHSRRVDRRGPPAEFWAAYRPAGLVQSARPGTLAHWLTERYCLYAETRWGTLRRAEIHHRPWPLQTAEVEIADNTMTRGLGVDLPASRPVAHYAERLDVHVWAPRTLPEVPRPTPQSA